MIVPGDRIRVEFVGRYASGEEWARGPLTLIYGEGTYPGAQMPVRVGAVERMQYVVRPGDSTVRLLPFQGDDAENEAFQVRHDRGQIIVEHRIVSVCRPMKVHVMNTGFGPIESDLGCWRLPRAAAPRREDPNRARIAQVLAGLDGDDSSGPPNGAILDPPPTRRPLADTSRYTGDDALHRAAREARPEIVGWLIARGHDPNATDEHGFTPVHYVGLAQRPIERYVPALEQSYLDVVDTLLAHGAAIDARVLPGTTGATGVSDGQDAGQTALGFAGAECADRLVAHLLQLGANANAGSETSDSPLIGAVRNGCPETVRLLLTHHANVEDQPRGGGTPVERLASVSAFHQGHVECARLLVDAGARTEVAAQRLQERLKDPGPGGFGFANRPIARRILSLLKEGRRRS